MELHSLLTRIGYKEIELYPNSSYNRNFYRRVYRHSSQKLPETGFVYYKKGMKYKSIIWTSFVKVLGEFRGTGLDSMQEIVVHVESDQIAYCSEPYKRNAPDLIIRVARRAWVNKYKITHIPKCDQCDKEMQIYQKFDTNQAMYICRNYLEHKEQKFVFEDWDFHLPPKANDFVESERAPRAQYRAKNKKLGKTPTPRRKLRKVWLKGKRPPKRE